MSLATTGGGGGFGGGAGGAGLSVAAMAHGGPNAVAAITPPQSSHHQGIPGSGTAYTAAPGTSYAALGADLLDKNQSLLNAKHVRNVAKLPIVAMDLYGDIGCQNVAYFPPLTDEDGADNNDEMAAMMKAMAKKKRGVLAKSLSGSGGGGGTNDVTLKTNDGDAYKAIKRYLNKGEGIGSVLRDAMVGVGASSDSKVDEEENTLIIPRPHLIMGARRISELNPAAKSMLALLLSDSSTSEKNNNSNSVIDQDDSTKSILLTTISLDGNSSSSSQPKGDDYDRVAYQMKLHSKKKIMTILPEEALGLVISKCKKNVMQDIILNNSDEGKKNITPVVEGHDDEEEEEEEYMDYPPAFAIPGWATMDSTLEALMDAAGGKSSSCGPSLHQRSVAACVGALLPLPNRATNGFSGTPDNINTPSKLSKLLIEIMQTKDDEAKKEAAKASALNRNSSTTPDEDVKPFVPLVLLLGATQEGIEITAMQISKPQGSDMELHCPFGNVAVVSSVCYAHDSSSSDDPSSLLESTLDEIRDQIGVVLPESEEPTAIVTYGSIGTQVKLASKLKSVLSRYGVDGQGDDEWDGWDADIPIISTKEDCVSLGLAVLAASVHGRVKLVVSEKSKDGKYRPKAKLAVSVQDVATCAVAISFNYFSGKADLWTEPKVIFDFDRRVPAGPYQIDFTAAECAAHVRHGKKTNTSCIEDESVLMGEAKKLEGSRGIPEREDAALRHRFRVYQRTSRKGEGWVRVGDDMKPLTMQHSQKDEGENGEDNLVAIESAVLEISLNTVGLISTRLITNGETIVQATKSKRNSKLARWGFMVGSILFVGGFLVKSYVEERIFQRDTERVLAYYKRAAPNSLHDGNEHGARYLVWKYKGKKDKLWRRLETKYGIPVKHAWEWDDDEVGEKDGTNSDDGEEEAEDLDSGNVESKTTEGDEF